MLMSQNAISGYLGCPSFAFPMFRTPIPQSRGSQIINFAIRRYMQFIISCSIFLSFEILSLPSIFLFFYVFTATGPELILLNSCVSFPFMPSSSGLFPFSLTGEPCADAGACCGEFAAVLFALGTGVSFSIGGGGSEAIACGA